MMNPDFQVYAVGLVYASVCTSLDDTEATRMLNVMHPTGVESQWRIANERFKGGEPNPSPCADSPKHRHILFSC